jgi:hypothetical protein
MNQRGLSEGNAVSMRGWSAFMPEDDGFVAGERTLEPLVLGAVLK